MIEEYIGSNLIKELTPTEDKTPMGDVIYEVTFEGGVKSLLSEKKINCLVKQEKHDATASRQYLVDEVGRTLYAVMMEYGLCFSEIDPVLNEIVRLANDGQNLANDHLWGNKAYERTLLDVNKVLLAHAESQTPIEEPIADEAPASDDGAAPVGSPDDSEVKD
jgi:hypothetical protein